MSAGSRTKPISENTVVWALVIGAIAFVFSGGRWNISVTAWIWPLCFLYYSRNTKSKIHFAILAVAIAVCSVIKWLNALAAGYFIDALFGAFWSLCWIIPFAADKLLTPRLKGSVLQSLVFPSIFVALDYLRSFAPTGSLGMITYTQEGVLPLVQIVSVTGSYGLAFLIYWFASAAVTWAEKRPGWKRPVCIYAAVITCVIVFGAVRLTSYPVDTSETVTVASVVGPFYGKAEDGEYSTITYEESESYLVSEAGRAAEGGADIACWNEEAFSIRDIEEQAFLDKAKALTAENDMILVIGYETSDTDDSEGGKSVDKSVIILPDGTAVEYVKTHLVPVMETASYVKGAGDIPTAVTEKAVISNVICFDDCFNGYMHGTGANTNEHFKDTEIMFVPSWDWSAVRNSHTDLSEFRAIENGESLVKVTYDGISTAVDNQGHVIKRYDTADIGFDTVQFADVPAACVHTLYSRYGEVIDALFLLPVILVLIVGLREIFFVSEGEDANE